MEDVYCVAMKKKDGLRCGNKKKNGAFCGVHSRAPVAVAAPVEEEVINEPVMKGLAITVTYSECVENHVGMQQLGNSDKATEGFSVEELVSAKEKFEVMGAVCELHNLCDALIGTEYEGKADPAFVLVVRNGVDILLAENEKTKEDMMTELTSFDWDTTAIMKGRLVNKKARHNVCFAEEKQAPDIENKKGTVIAFKDVVCTDIIRSKLGDIVGEKARALLAEGNKYTDVSSSGIGFHGDSERARVIAVRIGQSFPLHYSWFSRFSHIGHRVRLILNGGDLYIMSAKAVGRDWRCSSKLTLRHAAGAPKYLVFGKKK